ncbi:hypothetical protein [Photobacterium sanguinicancri]|uniref:hypothetical protein n=1 Tax=Photobacterium sanguinicancri TaxID=875932 RepID=UPI00247FE686|nr:hypothetical protein [Photobacterium sanguinicancri]
MPRKSFSGFHSKAANDAPNIEPTNEKDGPFFDSLEEYSTYQDLTAFPEKIAREASFRFKVISYLAGKCDKIVPKTIESYRAELPRASNGKVPSAITIYRWWLNFQASDFNLTSLAPNLKGRGNTKCKVEKTVDAIMEQAVEGVISGRRINISSAYRRVRRKVRQYNLEHGTKYEYPKYESIRKCTFQ